MTSTQHTTDRATWPAQVRLPGQTAAHPGPADMTMMYVMHHAFRRDLAVLSAAASVTPATYSATDPQFGTSGYSASSPLR